MTVAPDVKTGRGGVDPTKLAELPKPFSPDMVHWRLGTVSEQNKQGIALAYLDARDVMDRLDEVCGPHGWSDEYAVSGERVICKLTIYVATPERWADPVVKSDGAGDTKVEAEKGGISDAFKRAAVKWGIGRYLYRLDAPWVDVVPAGRSWRIADHEKARLRAYLETGKLTPRGADHTKTKQPDATPPKPAPKKAPAKRGGDDNAALISQYKRAAAARAVECGMQPKDGAIVLVDALRACGAADASPQTLPGKVVQVCQQEGGSEALSIAIEGWEMKDSAPGFEGEAA